uniref:Gypsy retrotransposon integrase-like protein 1 n=1 Tax=Gouania willdenowi TaxID=441366 RepID=A0A8C5FYF3_GOUWI
MDKKQISEEVPPANLDASNVQIVLPRALVPEVLKQLHNTPTGGHLGIQKLQGKVKDHFFWLGWFEDVKQWRRQCADCASRKSQGPTPCAPLQSVQVSQPYERVALDILGFLLETGNKNKYILVIGDYFSKWTEAFLLPNQEAQTIAKVLVEERVCRFGTSRSIHSDQGRSFELALFRDLCQLLNIHKTRTSPYRPQLDGLIDNQLNWDSLLPYVMMAYRSSVHASTGFTPYKVLFGWEMVLPVDIMLVVKGGQLYSLANTYVSQLGETLSTVVEALSCSWDLHPQKSECKESPPNRVHYNISHLRNGALLLLGAPQYSRTCPLCDMLLSFMFFGRDVTEFPLGD